MLYVKNTIIFLIYYIAQKDLGITGYQEMFCILNKLFFDRLPEGYIISKNWWSKGVYNQKRALLGAISNIY